MFLLKRFSLEIRWSVLWTESASLTLPLDGLCRCCGLFPHLQSDNQRDQCRELALFDPITRCHDLTEHSVSRFAALVPEEKKFLLSRGTKTLQEILSDRENISHSMQAHLDEGTDPWGVKVERVEMWVWSSGCSLSLCWSSVSSRKDVRLPVSMQRSMAAEAEGQHVCGEGLPSFVAFAFSCERSASKDHCCRRRTESLASIEGTHERWTSTGIRTSVRFSRKRLMWSTRVPLPCNYVICRP